MEAASNAGISASFSDYVIIHDDDDSWEATFLERCLDKLNSNFFPTIKGVITHTTQIFEKIEKEKVIEERRVDFDPELSSITLPFISEVNRFMPISFLFERSVFEDIGGYNENLPVIGDWEFNIRFLMKYDIMVIKENLANYHIRTSSLSEYSNTVTAQKDDHEFFRSLIINNQIREDIKAGRISQGTLMAQGDYSFRSGHNLWRLNQFLDRLKALPFIGFIRKIVKK